MIAKPVRQTTAASSDTIINAFENFRDAQRQIRSWMDYYNDERPLSRLDDLTPSEVYAGIRPMSLAA